MIGASREMVSRVMKDLENRGYFRVEEGRIVILEKRVPAPVTAPATAALNPIFHSHSPSETDGFAEQTCRQDGLPVQSAESAAGEDRGPPAGIALAGPDRRRQLSRALPVGLPSGRPRLVARRTHHDAAQPGRSQRRLAGRFDAVRLRPFGVVVDRPAAGLRLVGLPPSRRSAANRPAPAVHCSGRLSWC
jgi:hypothetical protein